MDKFLIFGAAALAVNAIGYVPYIRGIFAGIVKPQRITWGIWSILTVIAFINQVANGGGYSTLFFGSTAALVILVFALSIPKGVGGATTFDKTILTVAALLFIYWIASRNTYSSTLIAVIIDAVGALPTVRKAYLAPETEVYLQWVLAGVAGVLSLLAIPSLSLILAVYPLYIFLMNTVVVVAKYLGSVRQTN
jgi:hypothetical protein